MPVLIELPGTLTSTTGLERVVTTNNGFPEKGLTDLLLFSDGAGTEVDNAVAGRSAGTIEAPAAYDNAYAWLTNGGLQLEGSEIVSLAQEDASGAWSLVSLGAITGSVGETTSERICGLLSFKEFPAERGGALYVRGGNDWNTGDGPNSYQLRDKATVLSLIGSMPPFGERHVRVLSYNGVDTLTAAIYDKQGTEILSRTLVTNDTDFFTSSDPADALLSPCVGISSATYDGGRQEVEAFARYNRALTADDIARIVSAGVALGQARGRAW